MKLKIPFRRPRPEPTINQKLMALHRRQMFRQWLVQVCLLALRPSRPRLLAVIKAESLHSLVSRLIQSNTPNGKPSANANVPAVAVRKPPSWFNRHCPRALSRLLAPCRRCCRWLAVQVLRRLMLAGLCLLLRLVLLCLWVSSRGAKGCCKSPPRSFSAS